MLSCRGPAAAGTVIGPRFGCMEDFSCARTAGGHVTWRYEDGGPSRVQTVPGGLDVSPGSSLEVRFRAAPAATMVVGDGARTFLLRHTAGGGCCQLY